MKSNIKFPYPIEVKELKQPELLNNNSNYYNYRISMPKEVLNDDGLIVNLEKLLLVAEVNCSATMYRECFLSDCFEYIDVSIKKENLDSKFEIDCMMLAKEEIEFDNYRLDKGMPFMHLGSYSYKLDKSRKGLIDFIATDEKDKTGFDFNDDTISILLPRNEYADLSKMSGIPIVKQLLLNYAQLALLEACKHLTENNSKDHTPWYKELHRRWEEDNEIGSYPPPKEYFDFVEGVLKHPNIELARIIINNEKSEDEQSN